MQFSTTNILSTLALLTTLTSAAPTIKRQTYNFPPTSTSTTFQLIANVTSGTLPIQNFVVESYHTGAGTAYAVLANASTANPRIFYQNGTATEIRFGNSSTISSAGAANATFPEALTITPSDPATAASGRSVVEINAGPGQPYVGLTASQVEVVQLHGYQGETFYACLEGLEYGDAYQLFYRGYGVVTPVGCADVVLLPQCSGGSAAEDEFAAVSQCYGDVEGIDWSVYA